MFIPVPSATGAIQLLTDLQYLSSWLSNNSEALSKEASLVLTNLPMLTELEDGLLGLCGSSRTRAHREEVSLATILPHSGLPLYRELAWLRDSDWTRTINP